ncbi:MAG: NUMOD4 motif-containing HNH endonuclease [Selenomonadaceae bacterium]|nr:NUMOD4 motif-containing HNH endonuclease [Selenomonadaceae bacterium]
MTDDERKILEAELCKLSPQAQDIAEKFLAAYDKMTADALNGIICLPDEQWRDVVGYEGLYQVSNRNRMKSFRYGVEKLHLTYPNKDGYLKVGMTKDGKKKSFIFHVLVAQAFVPNPDGKPEVNHIDGNKQNNRPENLEWVTHHENMKHAWRNGLYEKVRGKRSPRAKITNDDDIRYIRRVYTPGHPEFGAKPLAKKFGLSTTAMQGIIHRITYKDVQ